MSAIELLFVVWFIFVCIGIATISSGNLFLAALVWLIVLAFPVVLVVHKIKKSKSAAKSQ